MLEATHNGGDSPSDIDPGDIASPSQPSAEDAVAPDDEADDALPLDVTFEILKNRRRRLVLEYVRDRDTDGSTTIGELAEHIAAIENDITVQELNAQQRKRVYIGLYQCHLPKMDDAGVVEFNQDRGRIKPGPNVEPLYEYLDVDAEPTADSPPQRLRAGGFVAFGVVVLAAQLAEAYTVATAAVVVFLVGVLAYTYWSVQVE